MIDKEHLMEVLAEEECLTADGFDAALVGCTYGANVVAVYDIQRMIEVLVNEGMDHDDAVEFLEYNVVSAYLGDKTPLYVNFVTEEVHHA
jgi:formylmethanofuran dehydrogenase subunit E